MSKQFHSSACIDDGATIGEGTRIWHFSHVMPGAVIGTNCSLGQNVFVAGSVKIGNNVKIQNNVSLYDGVVLEDYVFCGPSMVFTNVRNPRSAFPRNTADDYAETHIGCGASIGANATVVCGVKIGAWAFAGAGSVVNRDLPPYSLAVGVPAKVIGYISEAGHRLDFQDGEATCKETGQKYRQTDAGVERIGQQDES